MTENNKVVVITGASTGIGYDLSKSLLERGYRVYGSVRKKEDADRLKSELGDNFEPLMFDVTDHPAVDKAAKYVSDKELTGVDFLINNAGMVVAGPLLHVDISDFDYQMQVNVIGLMKVTQVFSPLLGARKNHGRPPGRILQISSVSGKIGMPFVGPYVASKHAVEGLSDSLRRELLLWGIDVIVIGPGAVKTPIWNKNTDDLAKYSEGPYGPAMDIFRNKFIRKAVKTALDSNELVRNIIRVMESKKPKTRYSYVAQWFTNYILPQILPPRVIDKILKKNLGF